ncbi:hypothetical protein EK403_01330 [Hansschlegelia zhihuaiae]|uniref:Uncharacterized protein n=1 Tax=Hansschlegelia zhihuaiae TaxID=405005 RepID=A0A4Q0MQW0_9HYPH|nr:hypothetical protein EK403_01330 [Hansschlegelia zhihuaiae]
MALLDMSFCARRLGGRRRGDGDRPAVLHTFEQTFQRGAHRLDRVGGAPFALRRRSAKLDEGARDLVLDAVVLPRLCSHRLAGGRDGGFDAMRAEIGAAALDPDGEPRERGVQVLHPLAAQVDVFGDARDVGGERGSRLRLHPRSDPRGEQLFGDGADRFLDALEGHAARAGRSRHRLHAVAETLDPAGQGLERGVAVLVAVGRDGLGQRVDAAGQRLDRALHGLGTLSGDRPGQRLDLPAEAVERVGARDRRDLGAHDVGDALDGLVAAVRDVVELEVDRVDAVRQPFERLERGADGGSSLEALGQGVDLTAKVGDRFGARHSVDLGADRGVDALLGVEPADERLDLGRDALDGGGPGKMIELCADLVDAARQRLDRRLAPGPERLEPRRDRVQFLGELHDHLRARGVRAHAVDLGHERVDGPERIAVEPRRTVLAEAARELRHLAREAVDLGAGRQVAHGAAEPVELAPELVDEARRAWFEGRRPRRGRRSGLDRRLWRRGALRLVGEVERLLPRGDLGERGTERGDRGRLGQRFGRRRRLKRRLGTIVQALGEVGEPRLELGGLIDSGCFVAGPRRRGGRDLGGARGRGLGAFRPACQTFERAGQPVARLDIARREQRDQPFELLRRWIAGAARVCEALSEVGERVLRPRPIARLAADVLAAPRIAHAHWSTPSAPASRTEDGSADPARRAVRPLSGTF